MHDHIKEAYELAFEVSRKVYGTVDLADRESAPYQLFIDVLVRSYIAFRKERA